MAQPIHICPRCDAEYRATVRTCADCDVRLVRKTHYERALDPLPFSEDLVAVRTDVTRLIKRLADALARAGIRCHVAFDRKYHSAGAVEGSALYYHTLYVRPEREEDARRVERRLEQEADVEDAAEDEEACPACGAPRDPGAPECPDCGLFLGTT
ncbi:MAG: hypothetical protein GVY18_17115 [Bacteroidetes bacterium]|jgi:hypothetical protein|nr:hypothetical protein [Bacteroidota bacterium]